MYMLFIQLYLLSSMSHRMVTPMLLLHMNNRMLNAHLVFLQSSDKVLLEHFSSYPLPFKLASHCIEKILLI